VNVSPSTKSPQPQTFIERGKLYRLPQALRILGWGQKAFRAAKRKGLKPITFGGARWLTGDQILSFFDDMAQEQAQSESIQE